MMMQDVPISLIEVLQYQWCCFCVLHVLRWA